MEGLSLAGMRAIDEVDGEVMLVAAARHDPAAFGELYRRYVGRVYRYLYSHIGDVAEAEDLTAQVFIAAWEGLGRYQERGNFAAWLFRIARNKSSDYLRRLRPQISLEDTCSLLEVDWDPSAQVEGAEDLQRLSSLVSQLEKDEIELLRLRFAADLSYVEIAGLLGRTEAAVKMAVHRLLRRLQAEWKACDERTARV